MSDIGISDKASMVLEYLFLIGFIPGFYVSYLLIKKLVKKTKFYFVIFYCIGGVILGYVGIFPMIVVLSQFITDDALPYIILFEIIIIVLHYVYLRKSKKK